MPVYNCATQEKLGITPRLGDNGKWTCGVRTLLQKDGCVVYSFGSNGETSYEEDILRKTVCEVHTFDPTLTALQEAKVLAVPGIQLHKIGLAAERGEVRCTMASCAPSVCVITCLHALPPGTKGGLYALWTQLELAMAYQSMGKNISRFPVDSLGNIMAELGHDWVDVLKIDIEGGEWSVLKALLDTGRVLPFTQLQVREPLPLPVTAPPHKRWQQRHGAALLDQDSDHTLLCSCCCYDAELLTVVHMFLQVEYHYFRSEMTQPSKMLEVLKELEARNVRVFHSEVTDHVNSLW